MKYRIIAQDRLAELLIERFNNCSTEVKKEFIEILDDIENND